MATLGKSKARTAGQGRVSLRGVTYDEYVRIAEDPANDHLRLIYHDGVLEVMSPHRAHEQPAGRIGMLVRAITCELGISCSGMRMTKFHRSGGEPHKGHGKEPDECFYLASEAQILGKDTVDLDAGDPPPDIWVEVDHRASSLGKLPLYAALRVPEIWRYRTRKKTLMFLALSADGVYESVERSLSLPMLTPAIALEALGMCEGISESVWDRRLRAWVRDTFGPKIGQPG